MAKRPDVAEGTVGTGYDEVAALVGPMVCSELLAQGVTRATQAAIEILEYLEKASIIRLLTTGLISAGFCNGSKAILAPLPALHRSF